MLKQLQPIYDQAAELLTNGKNAEAMELLGKIFSSWNTTQSSLGRLGELMQWDFQALQFEGESMNAFFDHFAGQLTVVKESIEGRDFVTLSDVLRYELEPQTDQWRSLLTTLSQSLEEDGSSE